MIHAQLKQRYGSVFSNTGSSYNRYKILLTAVLQTSITTFLELKKIGLIPTGFEWEQLIQVLPVKCSLL